MVPLIKSRQLCTVEPINGRPLKKRDIVLCTVHGKDYLHLISAIKAGEVQISNNRGRVNGWTPMSSVFGILTDVAQ